MHRMNVKMKVLVTGGTGLVGKHLREIEPGWKYLGSDDCDLTIIEDVERLLEKEQPDRIIHLAAKVGGILQNISNPADFYDENIRMNTNLLIASKNAGIPRLTSVLSTCMYPDKVDSYPMSEADLHKGPPAASNLSYGYSKRCAAVQIEAYRSQHKLNYNYLVPCNLYGEHDDFENFEKSHFVTALIKKIIESERLGIQKIELFGTGKPLRQFLYAGDFARIIKRVVRDDITESFNVAPPKQNYSIDQMARMCLEALSKKEWKIEYDSNRPDGQFRKDVDSQKMMHHIPGFAFTSFSEGVLKVFESVKEESEK